MAEVFAWSVLPDYTCKGSGWGTYYGPMMDWGKGCTMPSLSDLIPETIDCWVGRSQEATHPLLKIRYADVAWDFSPRVDKQQVRGRVATVVIDSVLSAAAKDLFPCEVEGYRDLRRALQIAFQTKDGLRIGRVRDEIIVYEDRHANDQLAGTWGISFDLLLDGARKIDMTEEHKLKIIDDLEGRLTRVCSVEDVAQLNPHLVQDVALRLARHYRKVGRRADLRRVLIAYATAYLRKAETNRFVGSAWLEGVYRKLNEFQFHTEAKEFQGHFRIAASHMRETMPRQTISVSIDAAAYQASIECMLLGDWDSIIHRLIGRFLPIRDQEMEQLQKARKGRFILDLFTPTLVDHLGRPIAKIGTMDQDPVGNLVHHVANIIVWNASTLRCIMEALVTERGLSSKEITEHIYQSPLFEPSRRPILEAGLNAYFVGGWVVAIHLLIPQIEDALRRLVSMTGGDIWREGKHEGIQLRTLDELLCDERAKMHLGEDTVFYLRTLLTDQRGLNVRNDVSHGITPFIGFNSTIADRLIHSVLLLGSLRPVGQEREESPATVDPPAVEIQPEVIPRTNPAARSP